MVSFPKDSHPTYVDRYVGNNGHLFKRFNMRDTSPKEEYGICERCGLRLTIKEDKRLYTAISVIWWTEDDIELRNCKEITFKRLLA